MAISSSPLTYNEVPGSLKVKYANLSDQANNNVWYSDDNWNADGDKLRFPNAGFDFDQWNLHLRIMILIYASPGCCFYAGSVKDGILDVSNGESALLNYQASLMTERDRAIISLLIYTTLILTDTRHE